MNVRTSHVLLASLVLIAPIVLTACNGSNDGATSTVPELSIEPESVGGTVARQSASVDDTEMLILSQNNNDFATDYYRQLLSQDENIVVSPTSISTAFAMLYAGSDGETKQEIQSTFYFLQDDAVFHQAFNSLSQSLTAYHGDDDFELSIVNALWGEITYDFSSDYLDHLSQFYGTDIKVGDIKSQANVVREEVNTWVEDQTESLIKNLLPENSVTSFTRLILANAVYFNAKWLHEFHPNNTLDRAFSLLNGESILAPTMSRRGQYMAYRDDERMLVELEYKNTDWAMYLISASVSEFSEFELAFDTSVFDAMLANASVQDIQLVLPKFSFGFKSNLNGALTSMGMPLAFSDGGADFSLINERQQAELFVNTAVHQAFITVDESGTEASAATGITIDVTSLPETYVFNQPFMFIIRHRPTGANLFIGRVLNPLE